MFRKALWEDGESISKQMLDWSSSVRVNSALDLVKSVMRHKGVVIFAKLSEDKLLPSNNLEDSVCVISGGYGFDENTERVRLEPSGTIRCTSADVGKYIRIRHNDKTAGAGTHPLTEESRSIMIEDDYRGYGFGGSTVLELSSDLSDEAVTLGRIEDCETGSFVLIDTTIRTGKRDYFQVYIPDDTLPTTPQITSLTTGFEEGFPPSGNAPCWIKVDWTEAIDDSGILKYEVEFVPYVGGVPNPEQAFTEELSIGDPLPLTLTIPLQESGVYYRVKVRATDNSHDRNMGDWSSPQYIMAGWADPPIMGPLTLTANELQITVSWDPVTDATGYQIKWKVGADFNWDDADPEVQFRDNMGWNNSTFSFAAIPHSLTYIKVRAYDGADQFSNISEGYKEVGKWYASPRRLKAVTGVDGSTWIKASWGDQGNDMTAWYGSGDWDFDITSNRWTAGEWEPVVMNGITCYYWLALNHRPYLYVYPEDMFIVANDAYRLKIDAITAWLVDDPSYIISPQAWDYEVKLEYFDETGTYIIPGSETYHRTHRVNLRRFYIRPTEHYWVLVPELQIDSLVTGRKYRIHVRSVGSEGVEFASEWVGPVDIIAGLPGYQLTMSQVEVITLEQGARVQWPAVSEAVGYEFVYTLDGSTPDFENPEALIVYVEAPSLIYDLMPPAGTVVKVKIRCYDQYGLVSSNTTEAEGISGGIVVEGEEQSMGTIDCGIWQGDINQHPATEGNLVEISGSVGTKSWYAGAPFTGAISSIHWEVPWDADALLRNLEPGPEFVEYDAYGSYVGVRVFAASKPDVYIDFPLSTQNNLEIENPTEHVVIQEGDLLVIQFWFYGLGEEYPGWDEDAAAEFQFRIRHWEISIHAVPVQIFE